jgi:alcohol dehydrogenase class IV
MLPPTLRSNRDAALADLATLARATSNQPFANDAEAADALISRVEGICRNIGIPERLSAIGVEKSHLGELVRGARGNSMSGNPREIGDEELNRVLEHML